jgi:hypothetical protein
MNASKLTAEQMEWICRYPLAQMLEDAQQYIRETTRENQNSPTIVYANARIQKVSDIFKTVGYWQDTDKAGN